MTARYPSLDGRSVLVTGGATGIGAAIVRAFADQGARVRFLDIAAAEGAALAAATGARFRECDLTDIEALRAAVSWAEGAEGDEGAGGAAGLDILVNNAARDERQDMEAVEPADWRRMLALNLDHHFFATQAAAAGMARRGGGAVVMLGSVSWMRGRPGMVGYTTAKAAIHGLTRTLARELGPDGIRVNCLVPGAILTERQQKLWLSPEKEREFLDLQALKHRLRPEHIARMALFLASEEAAGCTGASFVCDAGLTQN